MRVRVRLFANLREKIPDAPRGRAEIELEPGTTLQGLIDQLDVLPAQAPMVLVNGDQAPRTRAARTRVVLKEGDTVSIFPPLAGG